MLSSNKKSLLAFTAFWLTALCWLPGCFENQAVGQDAPGESQKTEQRTLAPVSSYEVRSHRFRREVEIPADVLPYRQVALISKVPGEVVAIAVAEGDKVEENQPLVKLDQSDFNLAVRQARAQHAAAQAGVEAAQARAISIAAKFRRFTALRRQRAVTDNEFEDVESAHKMATAGLTSAQAQVRLAKVGVDAALANHADTIIRAPFSGYVAKRLVDEGAHINVMPPTPVLVIIQTARVKIQGAVIERDMVKILPETKVRIRFDALDNLERHGAIERVEPMLDPMTRTAKISAVLDNADQRLKAGMSARITIELGVDEVPAIPDDAVIRTEAEAGQGWVFVLEGDIARQREVRTGERDGDLLEISEGLALGEKIVRGGQEQLVDGQQVRVVR